MASLPPGPSLSLLQTVRYLRNPYGLYSACHEKYGDPFTLPGPTGPMVVTGTPEGVRTILSAPPERYAAFGAELLAPVLGEYSMMLLGGEAHRAARRLLSPPFHSARMRLYGRLMQDCARQQIEPWLASQPFPVFPAMQAISLAVMVRAVFGVTEPERVQAYEKALIEVLEAVDPAFLFIAALRRNFGGLGPWARFVRRRERIERLLMEELASRRREQQPRDDILSLLLSARYEDGSPMSDTDIIGQLMTLLAAGHETTAISLSWALYLLHCHEDVLERLRAELRALPDDAGAEAVASLPLLALLRSHRFSLETRAEPGYAVRNTTVGPRRSILMRAERLS